MHLWDVFETSMRVIWSGLTSHMQACEAMERTAFLTHKVFTQFMPSVSWTLTLARVFSRDVVLGGGEIAFVGRENDVKNILKTNEICYCLGGKFKT